MDNNNLIINSKLLNDWDWEKNNEVGNDPNKLTIGSRKRAFWKCPKCGGTWNTQIKERRGCPYCNGFKVLKGFNDISTTNPELVKEWDFENNSISINEVSKGSSKVVFWKCKKGHSYEMSVHIKSKGEGCPICANKRLLRGYNDLATIYPEIALEFHKTKNGKIKPSDIIAGTKKEYWWKCCKCNYEWKEKLNNRVKNKGCPVCNNRTIVKGVNDIFTKKPELENEWDFEKNVLNPYEFNPYSRKKVFWVCKKGHKWKATIVDRYRGTGCPKCNEERKISLPEKTLLFYIQRSIKNVVANYKDKTLDKFEIDIYLSDYKIGIEYDGIYGHSTSSGVKRDVKKNILCKENGIKLIRVREFGCPKTDFAYKEYMIKKDEKFSRTLKNVLSIVEKLTKIEIPFNEEDYNNKKDLGEIYSLIDYSEKANSLAYKYPDVAKLWHPTKNGRLTPDNVKYGSSKVVWWKGKCGHEWTNRINYETVSGKCPICTGKRVLKKYNDLETVNPKLAEELDNNLNGGYVGDKYSAGSGKIVWWKCSKCNHSWRASIVSRKRGNGCPICSNRKVIQGYNDILSNKQFKKEWSYKKNNLNPQELSSHSYKKVWWKCKKCGYEWITSPAKRISGNGCPECAKEKRRITRMKNRNNSLG